NHIEPVVIEPRRPARDVIRTHAPRDMDQVYHRRHPYLITIPPDKSALHRRAHHPRADMNVRQYKGRFRLRKHHPHTNHSNNETANHIASRHSHRSASQQSPPVAFRAGIKAAKAASPRIAAPSAANSPSPKFTVT